jgi:hypothetical protein
MISKTKAAGRANATAAYKRTSHHNNTFLASLLKGLIVSLALRGLLPRKAAEWLIARGGLRHA